MRGGSCRSMSGLKAFPVVMKKRRLLQCCIARYTHVLEAAQARFEENTSPAMQEKHYYEYGSEFVCQDSY